MFTGIITDIGTIVSIKKRGDTRMEIATRYDTGRIKTGASIAVSGVCLTVTGKGKNYFTADVSKETLSCTTLGMLKKGDKVNLEQSLKFGDELGGHFVSGHVDAVAKIIEKKRAGGSWIFGFSAPKPLMRYITKKSSVTLDGVSLTINRVSGNRFWVNIIPHTLKVTTFGNRRLGNNANLEVDVVARYLEKILDR